MTCGRLVYMITTGRHQMSRIALDTAVYLLATYNGQTVSHDTVVAEITTQYQIAKKRTGVGSYFQVTDALGRAGVTCYYTGPDYTGECFHTFPKLNIKAA